MADLTPEPENPIRRENFTEFKNAPDIQWQAVEPNALLRAGGYAGPTRLLAHVRILGADFHAEAFLVQDEGGKAVMPDHAEGLDCLRAISGGDGDFQTVEIPGFPGRWVIAIYPFGW